ncbi:MAG TPA: AsmA family protein [Burkholderiaceae bacterium]|nr:AsmA family protein [Burkholderiaceae bacterium]
MDKPLTEEPRSRLSQVKIALALFAGLIALLFMLVVFAPWDWLREPLNRYASERLGRQFEITRRLEVHPGLTTRVTFHGVRLANPDWAARPYLLEAERADFKIKLWSLLLGRLNLPELKLERPQIALQQEPDGRRTWSLGRIGTTDDDGAVPLIGALSVDQGRIHYLAAAHGADISGDFSIDPTASGDLPMRYRARGVWKKEPFEASGRTGAVLQLNAPTGQPFPMEIKATAGRTSLKAKGTVASLTTLDGVSATFDLRGRSLADLYKLLGVVLPETPAYALQGELTQRSDVWSVKQIRGLLGSSDLAGNLDYDRSRTVALLTGKVHSEALDFNDLGPLIGLKGGAKAKPGRMQATAVATAAPTPHDPVRPATASVPAAARARVLPVAALDLERLGAMDADVWYSAARIRHAQELPLTSLRAHVQLRKALLQLDPLEAGMAGGQVVGLIHIDGNVNPAAVRTKLDAKHLQLNQLFPTLKLTKGSWGKLNGNIDLMGRGNSTARMLGTSAGQVALLMGKGEISNMLMEVLGLDGGEVIKFLLSGDRNVELRCAAAAFEVKQGVMSSQSIVLDTSDTVVLGQGQISLADETLDLTLRPAPKDGSILSLRSPLRIGGTFAAPSAGPDKGALARRVGLAVALAAVNPLLALAATVETGPGKDADCQRVLALAGVSAPRPAARP